LITKYYYSFCLFKYADTSAVIWNSSDNCMLNVELTHQFSAKFSSILAWHKH
jgi:hypothetical protein